MKDPFRTLDSTRIHRRSRSYMHCVTASCRHAWPMTAYSTSRLKTDRGLYRDTGPFRTLEWSLRHGQS